MALVTLQAAKDHLRIRTFDRDADLQLKVDQASAIVLDYLKAGAVAGWSDGTVAVPGHVEAATLLVVGHLNEHLGDDMKADEALWLAVGRLLMRMRDPALA